MTAKVIKRLLPLSFGEGTQTRKGYMRPWHDTRCQFNILMSILSQLCSHVCCNLAKLIMSRMAVINVL